MSGVVVHEHDAAVGELRPHRKVLGAFRSGSDRAYDGDRIHLLVRGAGQLQAHGNGLFRQLSRMELPRQFALFRRADQDAVLQDGRRRFVQNSADAENDHGYALDAPCPFCAFSIFAQVSRRATVRLNTSRSGVLSGSTQK